MRQRVSCIACTVALAAFVGFTSHTATAAEPKGVDDAKAAAEKDAAAKASASLKKVDEVASKHASKVADAKKKVSFDTERFKKEVEELHKLDAEKLKTGTETFTKAWGDPAKKVLGTLGIDLAAEAKKLAEALSASIIGSDTLAVGASGNGDAKTDLPAATNTTIVAGKAGALVPIKALGIGHASPLGVLHVHAISHDPLGKIAQSSAGYSSEITAPKGALRLAVDVDFDVPLTLTLAAAGGGASAAESAVVMKVLEHGPDGMKEVCSDYQSTSRSAVAVIGVAPQIKVATWARVGCKVVRSSPDKEQKYTVVVQGVASAGVKVIGGAHAVLDAKVKAPAVLLEMAKK